MLNISPQTLIFGDVVLFVNFLCQFSTTAEGEAVFFIYDRPLTGVNVTASFYVSI